MYNHGNNLEPAKGYPDLPPPNQEYYGQPQGFVPQFSNNPGYDNGQGYHNNGPVQNNVPVQQNTGQGYQNKGAGHHQNAPGLVVAVGINQPGPPASCRCGSTKYTVVNENGTMVWLTCLGLWFCTCCCWPAAFCIDQIKDKVFVCNQCNMVVHRQPGHW